MRAELQLFYVVVFYSMKPTICFICPGMWHKDLEGAKSAVVVMEGCVEWKKAKPVYTIYISMLHGPGMKLFLEMYLRIVLKAVVAPCAKAEPGEEGATDGSELSA